MDGLETTTTAGASLRDFLHLLFKRKSQIIAFFAATVITVAAGTLDVWAVDGLAGEEFSVRVDTRNDNGDGTTGLQPVLSLLDRDGQTRVDDTKIREEACPVASTCGGTCPLFTRRLPFSGTFYITVGAQDGLSCTGGKYKLVVRSPHGSRPTLVADDVPPGTFEP